MSILRASSILGSLLQKEPHFVFPQGFFVDHFLSFLRACFTTEPSHKYSSFLRAIFFSPLRSLSLSLCVYIYISCFSGHFLETSRKKKKTLFPPSGVSLSLYVYIYTYHVSRGIFSKRAGKRNKMPQETSPEKRDLSSGMKKWALKNEIFFLIFYGVFSPRNGIFTVFVYGISSLFVYGIFSQEMSPEKRDLCSFGPTRQLVGFPQFSGLFAISFAKRAILFFFPRAFVYIIFRSIGFVGDFGSQFPGLLQTSLLSRKKGFLKSSGCRTHPLATSGCRLRLTH